MDEGFVQDRILALRLQKNISAQKMSGLLGLSEGYLNKIELKKAFPSWPAFFKIIDFMGVTAKDFFDTDAPNPARLKELLEEARELDDETLEYMIGLARKIRAKKK
jgi:transcriptional regulator with XRE-family HTH domain